MALNSGPPAAGPLPTGAGHALRRHRLARCDLARRRIFPREAGVDLRQLGVELLEVVIGGLDRRFLVGRRLARSGVDAAEPGLGAVLDAAHFGEQRGAVRGEFVARHDVDVLVRHDRPLPGGRGRSGRRPRTMTSPAHRARPCQLMVRATVLAACVARCRWAARLQDGTRIDGVLTAWILMQLGCICQGPVRQLDDPAAVGDRQRQLAGVPADVDAQVGAAAGGGVAAGDPRRLGQRVQPLDGQRLGGVDDLGVLAGGEEAGDGARAELSTGTSRASVGRRSISTARTEGGAGRQEG
ncbi:MAG: hypothetical protein IPJ62_11095 [Betaproteobacteria bacterium]|nr:hypothetical protein [Betaproteobacteria bacterium]